MPQGGEAVPVFLFQGTSSGNFWNIFISFKL